MPATKKKILKSVAVKASAAAAKAAQKGKTLKQRAAQKISENLKDMEESQCFVVVHEQSGKSMEEMIIRDLKLSDAGDKNIKFGKLYYNGLRSLFTAKDSMFAALAAGPADTSVVDIRLEEANF